MSYGGFVLFIFLFFFFNDTATTEIYTLSLHDALPISWEAGMALDWWSIWCRAGGPRRTARPRSQSDYRSPRDRKSTRLNSSHSQISYAVFCLKKKKNNTKHTRNRYHLQYIQTTTQCAHCCASSFYLT